MQSAVWLAFGLLTLQLSIAVVFGRIFCDEHAVSRWAWPGAGTLMLIHWITGIDWTLALAGAIAALGLAHVGWLHFVALHEQRSRR